MFLSFYKWAAIVLQISHMIKCDAALSARGTFDPLFNVQVLWFFVLVKSFNNECQAGRGSILCVCVFHLIVQTQTLISVNSGVWLAA